MDHRFRISMIAPLALALSSCGAPTTALSVRVVDDAGQPVPHARVRAVPIGTSDVPLPVSNQTLGEAFAKTHRSGSTDHHGRISLMVLADRVHQVQVVPPMHDPEFSPTGLPGASVYFWLVIPDHHTVIEWSDPPNPPGLRLLIVDAETRGG